MKKFLLSALAVMATMGVFAQGKNAVNPLQSHHVEKTTPCVTQYRPVAMKPNQKFQAPKKLQAPRKSAESEMWYLRPYGTFYLGGQYYDENDVLQSYKYLVVPPFTELEFLNVSTDAASTKWFMGTNDASEKANEDNDFVYTYQKMPSNYVGYIPRLEKGTDTYQVAEYALVCDSMPQLVHPFNYADCGRYFGFSKGNSAFQSGPDNFDFDEDGEAETFYIESFMQFFEKPASPTLLYDVVLWATAPNRNIRNIGDLQLVFRRWSVEVDEDGNQYRELGDTIKILNCTSAEFETQTIADQYPDAPEAKVYPGTLIFAAEEEDEFGTPTATPFVLDDNYAILLTGFGLDEMDIRFYFTDQGSCVEEYEGWATPTFLLCCDEDEKYLGRLSYWNDYVDQKTGETVRYCYSIAYMFDVVMDGMYIEEGSANQVVPAEGGDSDVPGDDYNATYLFTNMPIFEIDGEDVYWTGYYDFEGIPEWAEIRIDPTYYDNTEVEGAENVRGLNLVWFEVEPLPEGVDGRTATIKVVSATGIESETLITLAQGNTGSEGVNTILFDANGKCVKSYNLAGRNVKNFKGITIQNGKKYLVK